MRAVLRSLALAGVAGGMVLSSGAAFAASPPTTFVSDTSPGETGDHHRLLTSVKLADGSRFEFIESGDGSVGVVEISPIGAPNRLADLTGRQAGTTLEVFLALRPGEKAPAALVDDHARSVRAAGRPDAAPRTLVMPAPTQPSVSEDYVGSQCDYDTDYKPGDSQFASAWYWGLGAFKDFTGQQTYFPSNLNGTNGKNWYAGVSQQRWLAACNGNIIAGHSNFQFSAQYRAADGTWKNAYTTQIAPYFKVVYSSSFGATHWRVKLSEILYNVMLGREYGVAVAGNSGPGGFESAH